MAKDGTNVKYIAWIPKFTVNQIPSKRGCQSQKYRKVFFSKKLEIRCNRTAREIRSIARASKNHLCEELEGERVQLE